MEPQPADDDGPAPYWKCIVAAAPQLLIALQCLLAHWDIRFFGMSNYDLTAALAVEGFALGAALMFGLFWVFLSGGPIRRTIRNWQIGMVFAAYAGAAYSLGAAEALQFLAMIIITYLGLLMTWKHPSALLQGFARWAVAYAALLLSAKLFGTPDTVSKWGGDLRVLHAAALYFFILGSVELSGFYLQYLPRNRVRILTEVYGFFGKTYP
jgi:hypothetical protein